MAGEVKVAAHASVMKLKREIAATGFKIRRKLGSMNPK